MVSRALLLCVVALPAGAHAAATILVLGDSISAGYGLPREQGWVSLLQQKLTRENYDYRVVNASISGDTTFGGKNRIAPALKAHRPSIVVVELGGNDGLRGAPPESIADNLTAIARACRGAGARVLLVGMRVPPNYGSGYSAKFHDLFRELAARDKLALVPFLFEGFAEKRELFQPDGIHPTAAAQPLLLDNVWKGLAPMLQRRGQGAR